MQNYESFKNLTSKLALFSFLLIFSFFESKLVWTSTGGLNSYPGGLTPGEKSDQAAIDAQSGNLKEYRGALQSALEEKSQSFLPEVTVEPIVLGNGKEFELVSFGNGLDILKSSENTNVIPLMAWGKRQNEGAHALTVTPTENSFILDLVIEKNNVSENTSFFNRAVLFLDQIFSKDVSQERVVSFELPGKILDSFLVGYQLKGPSDVVVNLIVIRTEDHFYLLDPDTFDQKAMIKIHKYENFDSEIPTTVLDNGSQIAFYEDQSGDIYLVNKIQDEALSDEVLIVKHRVLFSSVSQIYRQFYEAIGIDFPATP